MSRANLRAVQINEDSGEVYHPPWETNHAEAIREIVDLQGKYKAMCDVAAERERIIQRMERDREAEQEAAPERRMIEFLHGFWQKRTGHTAAAMSPDRHEQIAKLLRTYSKASAFANGRGMHPQDRQESAARRIMCAVVCVGELPYSDFGDRVASPPPNADRKSRVKRDSWQFIAQDSHRFEGLADTGRRWLREHGEALPDLPAEPKRVLEVVKDEED